MIPNFQYVMLICECIPNLFHNWMPNHILIYPEMKSNALFISTWDYRVIRIQRRDHVYIYNSEYCSTWDKERTTSIRCFSYIIWNMFWAVNIFTSTSLFFFFFFYERYIHLNLLIVTIDNKMTCSRWTFAMCSFFFVFSSMNFFSYW